MVERYGFERVEEEAHLISAWKEVFPQVRQEILIDVEKEAPLVSEETFARYSSVETLAGNFLDAAVTFTFCGDILREEDVVRLNGETYSVYRVEYQMIKLLSESGYSLLRLLERLSVDLGLKVGSRTWTFHRHSEG